LLHQKGCSSVPFAAINATSLASRKKLKRLQKKKISLSHPGISSIHLWVTLDLPLDRRRAT
jgi:hypothetical protein